MKKLILSVFMFSATLMAHDGDAGWIKGDSILLRWENHELKGLVGDTAAVAVPLSDRFGVEQSIETLSKEKFVSILEKKDGVIQGEVESVGLGKKKLKAHFRFVKATKDGFEGELNNQPFELKISANKMQGHHYVNPVFTVSFGNKTFEYFLEEGQACMGCSVKIAFTVLTLASIEGLI